MDKIQIADTKTLSELTDSIVKSRESKSALFVSYKERLNSIKKVLDFILNLKTEPLWDEIISESKSNEKWTGLKDSARKLSEELQIFTGDEGDFTIAASRASRTYVNIGSIGIMREGKSEFIAQTTQLDKWILPRKKGEHACTTASINVINGSSVDGKTEFTRVYYYTVQEIVTLFADYLEEFDLSRDLISCDIIRRDDLVKWCESNASKMEQLIPSSKSKLKQKFLEYIRNIKQYVERLVELVKDKDGHLSIASDAVLFKDYQISDIIKGDNKGQEYYSSVSYYKTPDSKAGTEVYTSFATSKAEVYTNFKVDGAEVNNIQFLDTPGIGEKKVGVDRILSEAVSMNLDIIIAIRALNGTAKEDQEQSFINILRSKVDGKTTAKDWIYYLLNIWDGQDYTDAEKCIKDLEYHLTTGEESSSISLDKDHFRVIHLRDGYQLNSDGSTDSNNPIGKYLKTILENLIPKIDNIDEDFFDRATTTYMAILNKYDELLSSARSMHLCNYDDYGRIQSLIDTLQLALAKENAKNPKIFTNIQHNIDDFCKLKDGALVAKIFGAKELSFSDSDSFYNKNKAAVQREYDEGSYNSNFDFQTYSNLKRKLTEAIREDIYNRMDQTEADRLLAATKETIAKVFIDSGKMGFVSQSPHEWFSKVLDLLTKEGCYPNLQSIISAFANHEIQARTIIEPRVKAVISKCIHHDDFGDPEDYDFQKYENAAMTIVHSLFAIESYAKGLINDGLISDDIEQLQISFSEIYFSLTMFAANPNQHKSGLIRDELYHFYENYSKEVFKGDKSLQKRSLVKKWRNNTK